LFYENGPLRTSWT